MIPLNKPFLPPKENYIKLVGDVWDRNWLTNNGPLLNELELELKEKLELDHLLFVTNGTIALQMAIKSLDLSGEIITTPFSYVATTSSIVWEGCTPTFVDIDKDTFNIDPSLIEAAINEKTTAILATHVFGNPCDVEAIDSIAKTHGLKVIYDAAHAFGVTHQGKSIFTYGDVSATSFHATKLFHTVEGGAVITNNKDTLKKVALLRNFGHTSATSFDGVGINGKNSELHAAVGLCNLEYVDQILARRQELYLTYAEKLEGLDEARQQKLVNPDSYNYAYFPLVFKTEELLLKVMGELEKTHIQTRRYFNPSLSNLNYVEHQPMPISDEIAKTVLCLPLYHGLKETEIAMICRLILRECRHV